MTRPLPPQLPLLCLAALLMACDTIGFDQSGCTRPAEVSPPGTSAATPPAVEADTVFEGCEGPDALTCAERFATLVSGIAPEAYTASDLRWLGDACARFPGMPCNMLAELCLPAFPEPDAPLTYLLASCGAVDVVGLLQQWCAVDASGCEILAKRTLPEAPEAPEEVAVAEDHHRVALEAASASCNAGDTQACLQAAIWRMGGVGTTPDPAARHTIEALCTSNFAAACEVLGTSYDSSDTPEGRASRAQARPWLERACALSGDTECVTLQKLDDTYDDEGALRREREETRALHARTAEARQRIARAEAQEAFARCERGDLDGCALVIRSSDAEDARQQRRARTRLSELCESGNLQACQGLAAIGDVASAHRACTLGDPTACELVNKPD